MLSASRGRFNCCYHLRDMRSWRLIAALALAAIVGTVVVAGLLQFLAPEVAYDIADRTRLQGAADSLIWSSSALASLGSGIVLAYASYAALGLLGAAFVVIPLWIIVSRRPALSAAA